jgi:hypothetical protein
MLSTNYSPVVNMVCRGMILAAVVIGICATPIYAIWAVSAPLANSWRRWLGRWQ